MRQYIIRRILVFIPTILALSLLIFALIRVVPGDAALIMLAESGSAAGLPGQGQVGFGGQKVSNEQLDALRAHLGLDRPLHEQYVAWVWGATRLDLGISPWSGKPVTYEIQRRIPVSAELGVLAMLVGLSIAIPVGVISAARQDTWMDYAGRAVSIGGLSVPGFWIGTLLIVFPSIWFGWLPPIRFVPLLEDPLGNLQQFAFPALALGAGLSASVMRMTRSQMLEVLRQDYVRTARAKGLRERVVIYRHALKNAMIPVITIMSIQFGHLLGGTVIMETIFNLPGVGRLTLDAVISRDYLQLQGNVLFLGTVFAVVNLTVDLLYAWLDPRIRYN